jgi:hypothetical protein
LVSHEAAPREAVGVVREAADESRGVRVDDARPITLVAVSRLVDWRRLPDGREAAPRLFAGIERRFPTVGT